MAGVAPKDAKKVKANKSKVSYLQRYLLTMHCETERRNNY